MKALGAPAAISVLMLSSTGLAEDADLSGAETGFAADGGGVHRSRGRAQSLAGEEPYDKARARSLGR
jgi:hypothetical protein